MLSTQKILDEYQKILDNTDYKKIDNGNLNPDTFLFQNWHHKIEKGWYGFSLGKVPFIWAIILDEFLSDLDEETKGDFKILQIKLKYGGLRAYLNYNGEKFPNIQSEVDKLEKALFHKDLIY